MISHLYLTLSGSLNLHVCRGTIYVLSYYNTFSIDNAPYMV